MMMARKVMGALVMGALGAGSALADSVSDNIVAQLETQGFRNVSTERTWLGRTRIIAEGEAGQREIVVNPNNGEILRDMFVEAGGGDGAGRQILQTADTSAALAGGVGIAATKDKVEEAKVSAAGSNRGGGREDGSRGRGETSRDDRGGRTDAGNGGPGG